MIVPVNSGCFANAAFKGVRFVSGMRRAIVRTAIIAAGVSLFATFAMSSQASAETRSLPIHFTHTGERAVVTFKKNGRYVKDGLRQLNHLVRDFRRNEATDMDPRLFDLLWEVYQASGSKDYIHVVSGYRSPATNAMLRSRSSGVAKKSQHMLGKAMDFYLSDVPVKKVREIGMKFQVGGVGYYPTSGVPFVHLDVGSVRAWPRMSREELVRLFPEGKTLHLPPSGQKLAGYDAALADYKRRVSSTEIAVAGGGAGGGSSGGGGRNLFAMLFGNTGDEDEDAGAIATRGQSAPAQAAPRQAATPPVALASASPQQAVPAQMAALLPTSAGAPIPIDRPVIGQVPAPQVASLAPVGGQQQASEPSYATAMLPENPPIPPRPTQMASAPEEAEADREFVDLASLAVPVPEFRSARSGIAVYPAGEAPRLAGSNDVTEIVMADAAAQVAAAGAPNVEAVPHPSMRPEATEVAALAPATSLGGDAAGGNGGGESAPIQLASLTPDEANDGSDAADALAERMRSVVGSAPLKGSRPTLADAARSDTGSVRGEPELNERMISNWATDQGRLADMGTAVKSPRFVSKKLRAAPEMVYTTGFSAESQEANRFTGAAVNFMTVARFGDE